jgi:hypothetical protein
MPRGSGFCGDGQTGAAPPSHAATFFLRVVGELGFHYMAVERLLLVEKGRRARAEAVRGGVGLAPSATVPIPEVPA